MSFKLLMHSRKNSWKKQFPTVTSVVLARFDDQLLRTSYTWSRLPRVILPAIVFTCDTNAQVTTNWRQI